MLNAIVTGAAALSLLGTPAVDISVPNTTPPPGQITVNVVTINGSGCKKGTAEVAVAPDNTAFTVTYSDYLAQVGVDAGATDWRKNCQISVLVNVPQGFTYAIARADYRGFASLAKGASAQQQAKYYFQGTPETTESVFKLNGPFSDDWQSSDVVPVTALVYKPCGAERYLN